MIPHNYRVDRRGDGLEDSSGSFLMGDSTPVARWMVGNVNFFNEVPAVDAGCLDPPPCSYKFRRVESVSLGELPLSWARDDVPPCRRIPLVARKLIVGPTRAMNSAEFHWVASRCSSSLEVRLFSSDQFQLRSLPQLCPFPILLIPTRNV